MEDPVTGQISEEDQEFLLDEQGNIYDLNGNFVAVMGKEEE